MFFYQDYYKKSYYQKLKIGLLGFSIFIVMGVYTLLKELKDSVFMIIVGTKYLPDVKVISLLIMVPLVFFYGWLSEKVSRDTLLTFCLLFYGLGGVCSAYFIQDPSIGLYNTVSSSSRIFGWFFYLFLEGASPFLVSAIWSFFNSISYPEDIKDSYISMTCMSKLGGIVFSGLAYVYNTYFLTGSLENEVFQYSLILFTSSTSLLIIPFLILFLVRSIPASFLEGYSFDKKEDTSSEKNEKNELFGLATILKNPYIIGIFGLTFFWEVTNVIFNNLRLNIAFSEASSMCGITAILYKNIFFMHFFGLFFVLFGTKNIVSRLGTPVALLLIPLITGGMIFLFLMLPSSQMVFIVYLVIRAINYTLTFPIKEALFIPTSKRIQFKTKSWIDSFGQKFSKGCGSFFNKVMQKISLESLYGVQVVFFAVLVICWIISDYFLGKKWEEVIKKKEIIS